MTFLEAALDILKREGRPLHFKELTERAMTKKLLTFVGRTPEVTMQTQLTTAVKKAPGNPFVRVKPGVFGLLRYPEMPPEEKPAPAVEPAAGARAAKRDREDAAGTADDRPGRRRRRRGGRTRGAKEEAVTPESKDVAPEVASDDGLGDDHIEEPSAGGMSAAARAAALAETGVLEGDDDDEGGADPDDGDGDDESHSRGAAAVPAERSDLAVRAGADAGAAEDADGDDALEAEGDEAPAAAGAAEGDDPLGRRRRRRRRRRRGGEEDAAPRGDEAPGSAGGEGRDRGAGGVDRSLERSSERASAADSSAAFPEQRAGESAQGSSADAGGDAGVGAGGGPESSGGDGQSARKIMTPVDAAIEILRGQPPGRGVHVRQLADSAIRRRLIHGEPNEAWRVIRTALASEPKDRLRNGLRPRVRAAGSGLYTLARRTPDVELERAEQVFGEARRALRERTMAAIERRLADLAPGAFEAVARVLLQREGFGPTTFVKRVDGTIYVEALRGRGSRPAKCLIALRPGATAAGRRAIGELRAGIRARNHEEGVLMLAGRLGEDGISEWKQPGPPLEIADGSALAETCVRHGIGVVSANVSVDFVDADFFAELAEG
jgi:hypothetical protein